MPSTKLGAFDPSLGDLGDWKNTLGIKESFRMASILVVDCFPQPDHKAHDLKH